MLIKYETGFWYVIIFDIGGKYNVEVLTKIITRCDSCKLSFIWGNMRTTACETAPQITLRNCSRETGFWAQFYVLSEHRISNKSGRRSFRVPSQKKNRVNRVSQYGLGARERSLITEGVTSMGIPGREAYHLHFSRGHSSGQCALLFNDWSECTVFVWPATSRLF